MAGCSLDSFWRQFRSSYCRLPVNSSGPSITARSRLGVYQLRWNYLESYSLFSKWRVLIGKASFTNDCRRSSSRLRACSCTRQTFSAPFSGEVLFPGCTRTPQRRESSLSWCRSGISHERSRESGATRPTGGSDDVLADSV